MIKNLKAAFHADPEMFLVYSVVIFTLFPLLILLYAATVAIFLDVIGMSVGACM